MLLAMAPFSRMHDTSTELFPQGLIPRDSESEQEGFGPASVLGYRMTETDHSVASSSRIRTSPMHKASQCRFLTWVAYTRNFAPGITPTQRGTCPMTGCERLFDYPELMLRHVHTCPRLSKGHYRCFESGKEEQIGKCDTEGCQQLKGRIVSAVNAVKRHFSGRGSKSRQLIETCLQKEVNPQENLEVDPTWDPRPGITELSFEECAFYPEMGIPCKSVPHGLDQENSGFGLPELGVTDNPTRMLPNHVDAQGFPSELSTGDSAAYFSHNFFQSHPATAELDVGVDLSSVPAYAAQWRQVSAGLATSNVRAYYSENAAHEQAEPAELCASGEPAWMYGPVHQQNPVTSSSSQTYAKERTDKLQANLSSANRFLPLLDINHSYQASRKTVQTLGTSKFSDKILADEPVYSVSQAACESTLPNMYHVPRMGSGTSSDASVPRSVFSTISAMSTHNSSMSSLDSTIATLDDCPEISTPFFGDESTMIYEEPESIDPLSLPPRVNHRLGFYSSSAPRTDSNGVSIDSYIQPGCYLSNIPYQEYRLSNQKQSPRKPTSLPSPYTPALPLTNSDNQSPPPLIIPSTIIQTSVTRKVSCKYCQFEPRRKDTSNLARHERACKSNPRRPKIKRFKCQYPGCRSAFTRADNLLVHQRAKNHLGSIELQVRFNPTPLSPESNMVLDAFENQCKVQSVELFRF